MKILITGSRKFADVALVFKYLDENVNKFHDIIIHGGAPGVDSIAESWCQIHKVKSEIIRPLYPSKKDYYLHRNAEMIGMCDKCIAFWDEQSRGTKFTFQYAKKRNKEVIVIKI